MTEPTVIDKFGSLTTRHTPESVPRKGLIKARNVRLHGDEVHPRPGLTLAFLDPYGNDLELTGIGTFKDSENQHLIVGFDTESHLFATNPYPGVDVGSTITVGASDTSSVFAEGSILKMESPAFPITTGRYMDLASAYGRAFMAFSPNVPGVTTNNLRQLYWNETLGKYRYAGIGLQPGAAVGLGHAAYASSATVGDIEDGVRHAVVLYVSETGYITGWETADVTTFTIAAGGFKLEITSAPVYPSSSVTRRIFAFTEAGASSDGPYFYIPEDAFIEGLTGAVDGNGNNISKTIIEDNTSTTATFNFPDEFLIAAVDVTSFIDKLAFSDAIQPKSIYFSKTQKRLILCGENDLTFRFSEVDDPETFMETTGISRPGEGDVGHAMCAREFRRELYLLRNNGGYKAQATAQPPSNWATPQMWENVGPEGPWAVDVCEEFMLFAHRSGPYVYEGNTPLWLGYDISANKKIYPNWDRINWDYAHLIYVVIDTAAKIVKIGVPMDQSTKVNIEFILDYSEGFRKIRWSYDDVASVRAIVAQYSPTFTFDHVFAASAAGDGKILFEDEDSPTLDGGAFVQTVQLPYLPGGEGVFQMNMLSVKADGLGELGLRIYASEAADPINLAVPLAGYVETFTRGVTGAQSPQWSLELTNNGVLGNYFTLIQVALYLNKIWRGRTPV